MDPDSFSTSSVSKGVFVFKPSRKQKERPLLSEDYFPRHKKEPSDCAKLRNETYQELWQDVEENIESLKYDTNRKLMEDLIKFLKNCHSGTDRMGDSITHAGRLELPTAALVTGVNVPDHSSIFKSLVSMFKMEISPHVIRLTGKQSNTLKALMASVIGQFIGQEDAMSSDEEGERETTVDIKKIPCTMQVLCSWYKTNVMPKVPPKEAGSDDGHSTSASPSLIIIFEDIEGFVPHVLQDFIQISSRYLSTLPLTFVFGIATAVTAIHRILPQSVSSLLSIEKFQAPHSSVSLNQLISKVLLTPKYPFKLGAKVFLLLLDLFLYHDFSFTNFVKGIKFSMIEHFFNEPLSFLCTNYDEAVECVRAMSHDQLELCRQLRSFRRYVENQPPKEQRALLLDDKHLKGIIEDLLEVIHEYHNNFYPVLLCLHELTSGLPQSPLGKKLRELYAMTLEENIWVQDGYRQAMSLVRLFAREELMSHLDWCIDVLGEEEGVLQEVALKLTNYRKDLDVLANTGHLPVGDNRDNGKSTVGTKDQDQPSGKVTLQSLQEKLMVDAKKKKELTQYEALREEIVGYLEKVFRKVLVVPQSLTLHEIFYFDNVHEVRQHLHAAPRAAIQTALSNPYIYLQNEACKIDPGSVTSSLPDVCIVYKLHLEYGRLINLYDWLQAFITVVTGQLPDEEVTETKGGKKGKSEKKDEREVDPELHARFIRAVSELQFLGFIKPTKQKTDHVHRLTWGGC